MSDPLQALQKALYDQLGGTAALNGQVGARITDTPSRGLAHPFVQLSPRRADDWSTGDATGFAVDIALEIWSRAPGFLEAQGIAGTIRGTLEDAVLSPEGFRVVQHGIDDALYSNRDDGQTRHVSLNFHALLERQTEQE